MTDDNRDPFAHGGYQPEEALTPAERRFIEAWRKAFPNYRFELSNYAQTKDGEAQP